MFPWLLLAAACSSPNSPTPEAAPPAGTEAATAAPAQAPAAQSAPAKAQISLEVGKAEGWGAVFWRDGKAVRVGGGWTLIGAGGSGQAGDRTTAGPCGGINAPTAPERAVLALPERFSAPTNSPEAAPANPAAIVERAAWRVDEQLPPRDDFSPAVSAPDPALQRGVHVASVVKTRRAGAPPVLITSGARDCHGVVALLNADASKTLVADSLDGVCDPLAVLPSADLDGDGSREFVASNKDRVILYRLVEGVHPGLVRLADWSCGEP